ncbi:uncharacterized protein LOC129597400 [Paramacrobiotus metropolitanus]|uniref:uncharacterized protein LOC129597400 n=1 Tax=Paramacrobiotus metropolitanus TaxID=2943436 RepID=UPI002445CAAA|nr:uncharacterized protein LOC129597400 [Paramacrobiotus metropolitanus]
MDFYSEYVVNTKKPKSVDNVNECQMSDGKTYFIYCRKTVHVPRLALIRPQAGDVWYLRLLLKHVPSRSYEQLRTVNGEVCESFADAATKLGLFNDSTESKLCMEEAIAQFCSPAQLRTLFFLLVTEGAPGPSLYETFKSHMAEDYRLNQKLSEWESEKKLLSDLFAKFDSAGKNMNDFGLTEPFSEKNMVEREIARYNPVQNELEHEHLLSMLNNDQREIYDYVVKMLETNSGGLLYINGAAGTGKTFLVNCIANLVRAQGKIALCCASTAVAASNYGGGRTAHSMFQTAVENNGTEQKLECNSMKCFKKLDALLKCVEEFFLLELVISDKSLLLSSMDQELRSLLDKVGDGTFEEDEENYVVLPEYLNYTTSVEEAKAFAYPNLKEQNRKILDSAILSLRNYQVDELNADIYKDLAGKPGTLYSFDELNSEGSAGYFDEEFNEDFLHSLNENNVPPHELKVKEGMECYLLRNLSPEDGLLNNAKEWTLPMDYLALL